MGGHKHIERCIGAYIARHYRTAAEVGVGGNPATALALCNSGTRVFCTDVRPVPPVAGLNIVHDDIFNPDLSLYRGLDLVYSIRPHEEMVPALITLARAVDSDLLVYHLGCEIYRDGGEVVDAGGVQLHLYHRRRP